LRKEEIKNLFRELQDKAKSNKNKWRDRFINLEKDKSELLAYKDKYISLLKEHEQAKLDMTSSQQLFESIKLKDNNNSFNKENEDKIKST